MKISILMLATFLTACTVGNPNPGEKTVDSLWERGQYFEAFDTAFPAAQRGEPWAQLRLGMYYDTGAGVETDTQEAVRWYSLAARQLEEGRWAEGNRVGFSGKSGYFGQKHDALIAQYHLADLYSKGEGVEKNLALSWLLINNVIKKSEGKPVFFCCGWSGGRQVPQSQLSNLKFQIESELNQRQLSALNKLAKTWILKYEL